MFFFFYKTTNLENGKVYYGVHKTANIDDGYIGSGRAIMDAKKLYGQDSFKREIVKFFNTEEEMYKFEKEFITEDVVLDRNTYNMTIGGRGGFSHIDNYGDKNPMRNPEIVKKNCSIKKERGTHKSSAVLEASIKNLKKAIASNTGKQRPIHSEKMKKIAKDIWSKNREKMLESLRKTTYSLSSPSGEHFITNQLQNFCIKNDIPYVTIWTNTKSPSPVKKGKAKGWKCEVVNE